MELLESSPHSTSLHELHGSLSVGHEEVPHQLRTRSAFRRSHTRLRNFAAEDQVSEVVLPALSGLASSLAD